MKKTTLKPRTTFLTALTIFAFLAAAGYSEDASASYIRTPFEGERPYQLDAHVGFATYNFGLATGLRFGIPILDNGFIKSINNAVYINFGADFLFVKYFDEYSPAMDIPAALHWEFYFTEKWSAYAEFGLNIYIHPSVFRGYGWYSSGGYWITGSVGGRFQINDKVALTMHVGSPYCSFGVMFSL